MKTLSTLMMNEFVDMSCGNFIHVLEEEENPSEEEIRRHVNKLLLEYKMLVNPVGMKVIISQEKQSSLRTARIYILKICSSLLDMECYDDVRDIVNEMGWHCENMKVDVLEKKVRSELRRFEFELKRYEQSSESDGDEHEPSSQEIRSMFDKELAMLMTYFKMCISMNTISAAVYANMVAQADREIQMRKASVKR